MPCCEIHILSAKRKGELKARNATECKLEILEKVRPILSSGFLAQDAFAFVQENALKVHFQGFGVGGFGEGFGFGDDAVFDELEKGLVEVLHAVFAAGLDGGGQFVQTVFLDEFSDGRRVDHDFDGRDDAALNLADHALAYDGLERSRQLSANLVSFFWFEEV